MRCGSAVRRDARGAAPDRGESAVRPHGVGVCGCTGDGRRGERQLRGRGVRPGLKSGLAACARGCTSTTQEVLAAAASRRGSGATSAASPKQRPAPRVSGCPGLRFEESSTWSAWVELLRAAIDARWESGVTRVQAWGSKLRSRGGGGGVTRRGWGGRGGGSPRPRGWRRPPPPSRPRA